MADPFVQEILDDAKRMAAYGRHAGTLRDNGLFQAIADADALPDPRASSPEVIRLQAILNDLGQTIPFPTQAALKKGWDPANSYLSYPRRTYRLIVLAILLMIATGSLTVTYNKGVALLGELDALAELGYRSRMDALIWDQAEARAQLLRLDPNSANPTELELARDAHFTSVYELRSLSERMNAAYAQSVAFEIKARFPVPGSRSTYCLALRIASEVRQRLLGQSSNVDPVCVLQALPSGTASLQQIIDPDCEAKVAQAEAAARDTDAEARSYYARFTNEIEWTTRRLGCSGLVNLGPQDLVPPLTTLIGLVNDRLAPYALWLLPALYGAMGAMLFHLRLILNPLQPDPPLARLLLRLSLGALAGIVLTWFVTPESRLDLEVADIGFTLLGFAFLFGFSLDVFFAVLDRFVSASVATVQRLGGGSSGASPRT